MSKYILGFLLVFVVSDCYGKTPIYFPSSNSSKNITVRKNIFGGYNYYRNGRFETQSRPNIHGGYTYRGKFNGLSTKTQTGYNIYEKKR